MNRYITFAIALICNLIATMPAQAEPPRKTVLIAKYDDSSPVPAKKMDFRTEITEEHEYYDVSGTTPEEIRHHMTKNGTKWDDGQTYDAVTTWDIRYRYDTTREGGGCYVTSAKTKIGIIFRYPRFTPQPETPESVLNRWNTYMNNLQLHEIGHRDLAVDAAHEISESLSAMGSFTTCREADKAVAAVAKEKLGRMKQSQKDYDATTRHGATQGAVFP